MKRALIAIAIVFASIFAGKDACALSFSADSIAAWGKFPRFCMKVYRWGDQFFNGYDTAYVKPTGYRFNAKIRTNSWLDQYTFLIGDDMRMNMSSSPSTSLGFWLTYMAVSVGYDVNLSEYYHGSADVRKTFNLQFNCSLFAATYSHAVNTSRLTISSIKLDGKDHHIGLRTNGMRSRSTTFNAYYFFNHKKYSFAAAYSFGRRQVKSAGSFFLGFNYWYQGYDFDFNSLPEDLIQALPEDWSNHTYRVRARNYGVKVGYGYNWVLGKRWTIGVSESPTVGVRHGYINTENRRSTSWNVLNMLRMSAVWNSGPFFGGLVGYLQTTLVKDRIHTLLNNAASLEVSIGYRFNLW